MAILCDTALTRLTGMGCVAHITQNFVQSQRNWGGDGRGCREVGWRQIWRDPYQRRYKIYNCHQCGSIWFRAIFTGTDARKIAGDKELVQFNTIGGKWVSERRLKVQNQRPPQGTLRIR